MDFRNKKKYNSRSMNSRFKKNSSRMKDCKKKYWK